MHGLPAGQPASSQQRLPAAPAYHPNLEAQCVAMQLSGSRRDSWGLPDEIPRSQGEGQERHAPERAVPVLPWLVLV